MTDVTFTMHLQTRLNLNIRFCIGWKVETSSRDRDRKNASEDIIAEAKIGL